eukprot:g6266.t1
MSYWIVSVPTENKSEEKTRQRLYKACQGYAEAVPLKIPTLKVGTLDTLMGLSDKLGKIDTIVEGIAKKIERTFYDINREKNDDGQQSADASSIKVEHKSATEYVEKWSWNRNRYNPKTDLHKLADEILESSSEQDLKLKKKMTEFSEIKTTLSALERKENGTLLVKSLGPFISGPNARFIIDRDWITTLLVVVPKDRVDLFLEEYEIMEDQAEARAKKRAQEMAKQGIVEEATEAAETKKDPKKNDCRNVVPGSAQLLTPTDYPGEFCLYRILVFKKGADAIKGLLREKRYTTRTFEYNPQEEKEAAAEKKSLEKAKQKLWRWLVLFCKTTYADVFAAWIHIKAMRVFCESVLRYGLPPEFQATLLAPGNGKEPRLRAILKDLYKDLPMASLADLQEGEQDLSGLGADFYPYVYTNLNTVCGK